MRSLIVGQINSIGGAMDDTNSSYVLEVRKIMDYFVDMIKSYYPGYIPSDMDITLNREAVYEFLILDNKKFEELKEVIDFISMNNFWRQNISNLKQVRTKFHAIARDMKSLEMRKKKEKSGQSLENESQVRLKKIFESKEKKERSKERKGT